MTRKSIIVMIIYLLSFSSASILYAQGTKTPEKESTAATDSNNKVDKAVSEKKEKPEESSTESEDKYTDADAKEDKMKVERIEKTLEYGVQKDRITAMNFIKTIKSDDMKKRVILKVINLIENDPNIEAKKTAITVVGNLKRKEAIPALIKALDDKSEDIQIAACYALGRLEAHESKDKVIVLLKKQDLGISSNLTESLIILLTDLKAQDILDYAIENVKEQKTGKMARERFMLYIGKVGSAAQKDFLLELLNDDAEDMTIRSHAVKALGALKIKDSTDDLKKLLKDIEEFPFKKKQSYYNLSMHAVTALVALGDTDSVELLMNSLRSDNAGVRLNAVKLIKDFDDERTIDILKYKMKYDPNERVKSAAKKALEEKGLIEKDKDSDDKDTVEEDANE